MDYKVKVLNTVIRVCVVETASGPDVTVGVRQLSEAEKKNSLGNAVSRNMKNKVFDNLADPIFKLPFEHGWSRELCQRQLSCKHKIVCGVSYHHSSTSTRCKTLKEIQSFLETTTDNTPLTTKNFSFMHKPIGMKDQSKEFFTSTSGPPNVLNTNSPGSTALRSNENSSKVRIVENRNEQNQPSTSKYKKSDLKATPSGSKHLHDVQSSSTSKNTQVVPLPHDNKIRNVRSIVQSSIDSIMALQTVMKDLKIDQILAIGRVCNVLNDVSTHSSIWQNVCLKDCTIHDWKECIEMLNFSGTVKLNTYGMIIPENNDQLEKFWKQFTQEIGKANNLKGVELHKCPIFVVNEIMKSLPQLEVLHATSIKDTLLLKPGVKMNNIRKLNFRPLNIMTNLTELKIKGLHSISLSMLPSFSNLINLKIFALTSFKDFPRKLGAVLNNLTTGLEQLEIGDCNNLPNTFGDSIKRLVNLKSLRLENCNVNCEPQNKLKSHTVFTSIRDHPNLEVLELVNIKFCKCLEDTLGYCVGLKALLIILAHNNNRQHINRLTECLKELTKTLTHYVCGLTTVQVVRCVSQPNQDNENNREGNVNVSNVSTHKPTLKTSIPIYRNGKTVQDLLVDVYSAPKLKKTLGNIFKNTKLEVIEFTLESATSFYLTDHFDDIM